MVKAKTNPQKNNNHNTSATHPKTEFHAKTTTTKDEITKRVKSVSFEPTVTAIKTPGTTTTTTPSTLTTPPTERKISLLHLLNSPAATPSSSTQGNGSDSSSDSSSSSSSDDDSDSDSDNESDAVNGEQNNTKATKKERVGAKTKKGKNAQAHADLKVSLKSCGTAKIKTQERDLTRKISYLEKRLFEDSTNQELFDKLTAAKEQLATLTDQYAIAKRRQDKAEDLDTYKRRKMIQYDQQIITKKLSALRKQLEMMLVGVDVTPEEVALRNELADLQEKKLYIAFFPAYEEYINIAKTQQLSKNQRKHQRALMKAILKNANYTRPTYRMSTSWTPEYDAKHIDVEALKMEKNQQNRAAMHDDSDDDSDDDDVSDNSFAIGDDDDDDGGDGGDAKKKKSKTSNTLGVDINNDDAEEEYDDVWGENKRRQYFYEDDIEANIQVDDYTDGGGTKYAGSKHKDESTQEKFNNVRERFNKFKQQGHSDMRSKKNDHYQKKTGGAAPRPNNAGGRNNFVKKQYGAGRPQKKSSRY